MAGVKIRPVRGVLTAALLLAFAAGMAAAQTIVVNPGTKSLAWDQAAPDLATAQAYEYAVYINDGARTVVTASCTGAPPSFVCTTRFPVTTLGMHEIKITAAAVAGTERAESLPSTPFAVRIVVAPVAPRGLRVVS
jgi:hypothetical protein